MSHISDGTRWMIFCMADNAARTAPAPDQKPDANGRKGKRKNCHQKKREPNHVLFPNTRSFKALLVASCARK